MEPDILLTNESIVIQAEGAFNATGAQRRVCVESADLELRGPAQRWGGQPKIATSYRRALVHYEGDVLVINYKGDFTGGVRIEGDKVVIHAESVVLKLATPTVMYKIGDKGKELVKELDLIQEIDKIRQQLYVLGP